MNNFFKQLLFFFVPYGIYKIYKNKKNVIDRVDYDQKIENWGFSEFYGKEVVVFGSGPSLLDSLKNDNLHFINSKIKICVNEFLHSHYFEELKPEFVFFADPAYWCRNLSEELVERYAINHEKLLGASWEIAVFMPNNARSWNFFSDIPSKNKYVNIYYFNTDVSNDEDVYKKFESYKINKSMPRLQNVLVAALYCAVNIGFSKIYLLGADHSWHESIYVTDENIVCYKDSHFYDKKENSYTPVWKNGEHTETFTMAELFEAFSFKYKAYLELNQYANFMKSKIYNASSKSCIDAFERFNIDKIEFGIATE